MIRLPRGLFSFHFLFSIVVFGRMISISLYITLHDPGILGSISLHSNGVGFLAILSWISFFPAFCHFASLLG
jgi:ABC-type Fe3+-siderophore transport system permease subunit